VQDSAVAEPESDVVSGLTGVTVRDEVAGRRIGDLPAGVLLLVGVARDEAARCPEPHVDEARAVDSLCRHPAPFVAGAEVGTGMGDGVGGVRLEPCRILAATQGVGAGLPGIAVGGLHPRPLAAVLEDAQRLAGQRLGHLLRIVARLGSEPSELACERMFA